MLVPRADRSSRINTAGLWPGVAAASLLAALLLCGCQGIGTGDVTGSIGQDAVLPGSLPELERYADDLGRRYDADPDNKQIALTYARALRALTRYAQAIAVVQKLAAKYPKDMNVLGAYGKALADAGRLREAATVLPEAHTPEQPNWSILSAQGAVADELGDHDQAQAYYSAALKIAPNQPQVLSNLGLSYALAKQLPLAESTLQQAAAQPGADMRVRQNFALVLALEGKFDAAQKVAQQDLSPIDAAENVAAIRQMIAQADPWDEIRKLDAKKTAARKPERQQYDAKSLPQPLAEKTRLGAADAE
ncbi:MAG TPA: tetratricopeptide repeat protein [Methylovirgula sp.]|nr:tetratricopeptide repeat protein [Methylovirgula sp.]